MKELLIFGAGTLAKLAHYYTSKEMGLRTIGFVVDDEYKSSSDFLSLPLFSWSELNARDDRDDVEMHVAIGYRSLRLKSQAYDRAKAAGFQLLNVISTKSYVAEDVVMGDNNIIMPGAVIEPCVKIGSNNVVWSNATICHDVSIGDGNFIASGVTIGGEVVLGNGCFLGFSSVVLQGRRVGDDVLLGAQSLALHDLESLSCYYGSPATLTKRLKSSVGVEVN